MTPLTWPHSSTLSHFHTKSASVKTISGFTGGCVGLFLASEQFPGNQWRFQGVNDPCQEIVTYSHIPKKNREQTTKVTHRFSVMFDINFTDNISIIKDILSTFQSIFSFGAEVNCHLALLYERKTKTIKMYTEHRRCKEKAWVHSGSDKHNHESKTQAVLFHNDGKMDRGQRVKRGQEEIKCWEDPGGRWLQLVNILLGCEPLVLIS